MPMSSVVKVEIENMVATSAQNVTSVSNNVGLLGGTSSSSSSARTKDAGYDVWDEDWSQNQ